MLGVAVIAWQNRDRLDELLGGLLPKPAPLGDPNSVAPDDLPADISGTNIYSNTVKSWTSSKWNNGKKRTLTGGKRDPDDNKFYMATAGSPNVTIDGKGVMTVNGGTSPRLTVKGPWKSTEITFFTKGNIGDWLAIHGGSDHHEEKGGKNNTWGGYAEKIYKSGDNSGVQKEPIHGTYCRANSSSKTKYSIGSGWVGWKGVQLVEGSNVVLEGYVNENGNGTSWKKLFHEVDNGNFKCGPGKFQKPQTSGGPIAWIRFNGSPKCQIKDLSVREILK